MKLADIRTGLATVLRNNITGVLVADQWPDAFASSASTWLIVLPGDPYVTYFNPSRGMSSLDVVAMRVVVLPLQGAGPEQVQDEIDALLSCGSAAPRSIRTALASDLSALGTACSVVAQTAAVRTYQINGNEVTGAEVALQIQARC